MRPVDYAALAEVDKPPAPVPVDRVHALLLNGGGAPEINYSSHLAHLKKLSSMLLGAGVGRDRITIFSGDGDDPDKDLTVVDPGAAQSSLLASTGPGKWLKPASRLESSAIADFTLRPATIRELRRWFKAEAGRMRDGDTLILYVTDHGTGNAKDVMETKIVLWGEDASISVRELRDLLRTLPRGVRVVTLMSQCFSGGFAWLSHKDGAIIPDLDVCGYFASRFDRLAYGCYASVAGQEDVGHSFAFFRGLEQTGSFDAAHRAALVTDRTPDAPVRTSDLWLQQYLADMAIKGHLSIIDVIDTLLTEAWKHPAAWEREIRLLDSIGQTYGFSSPRSVRAMEELAHQMKNTLQQIQTHTEAWSKAVGSAKQANLVDFLTAEPTWTPLLDPAKLKTMAPAARQSLADQVFPRLDAFTVKSDEGEVIRSLSSRSAAGEEIAFRTEVRVAALIRIGALLTSIAGRAYLASYGEPELLRAYGRMRACERLSLPGLRVPDAVSAGASIPPLPTIDDDLQAMDRLVPAWTGLVTRAASDELIAQRHLPSGASEVVGAVTGSPAAAASIRRGDVLLGPPNKAFTHPQDLLPWSLSLKVGEPQPLTFIRGKDTFTATIVPRSYPIQWPSLPRPPAQGVQAPPVAGVPYRGARPSGRQVLFFWATWCGPCKAMLPSLLRRAKEHDTPIVAITDEGRATLDAFFAHYTAPFPSIVISDETRRSFVNYGISGTPTVVLLDEAGVVRGYQVGYDTELGVKVWPSP